MSATYSARLEGEAIGAIARPYLAIQGESNARQGNPDPDDFATDGYTLAHGGGGFPIPVGGHMLGIDVQVRNLFNRSYASLLSRCKTSALDPGRNVVMRVGTTF